MNLKDKEPELMDEVKHKTTEDISGIVIAKYPDRITGEQMLDIRLPNDSIHYNSPVNNWEVVKLNKDGE